jgi:peroxiredoxin
MVAVETPVCNFGWKGADFNLSSIDGNMYTCHDLSGSKGVVVMFICNHCPFVKSIIGRIVRDAKILSELGVNCVAICSNDDTSYPEDSFENMKVFAQENDFCFPYLHDGDQSVAKAYGAVCTPDFFGFNKARELQYRGRFDSATMLADKDSDTKDLLHAMEAVAETGRGPENQMRSVGCSIKWKTA